MSLGLRDRVVAVGGLLLALTGVVQVTAQDHDATKAPDKGVDWTTGEVKKAILWRTGKNNPKGDPVVTLEMKGAKKRVVIESEVSQPQGGIEYFLVRPGDKDHETLLTSEANPMAVNLAYTAAGGGKKGRIYLEYELKGKRVVVYATDWLKDSKKELTGGHKWSHLGNENFVYQNPNERSDFTRVPDATHPKENRVYAPVVFGEIMSIDNSPNAMFDIGVPSPSSNDNLRFTPNEDLIPPRGTRVRVVMEAE